MAIVVATRFLELRFEQRRVARAFEQMVTGDLHHGALAG
jgi:hypothetical protein